MSALLDLIQKINPNAVFSVAPLEKKQFYAHFNLRTLEVVAISNSQEASEDNDVIEIDEELAKKFLSGKENIVDWAVGFKDDIPELHKIESISEFYTNRVELNPIVQVQLLNRDEFGAYQQKVKRRRETVRAEIAARARRIREIKNKKIAAHFFPKDYWKEVGELEALDSHIKSYADVSDIKKSAELPSFFPKKYWDDFQAVNDVENLVNSNDEFYLFDVMISVNESAGTATFTYSPSAVKMHGSKLRFYFTREDDPSHLKCVIKLDEKNLDRILEANSLEEWPNPLTVKIPYGTEDLSIFTPKTNLEIVAIRES